MITTYTQLFQINKLLMPYSSCPQENSHVPRYKKFMCAYLKNLPSSSWVNNLSHCDVYVNCGSFIFLHHMFTTFLSLIKCWKENFWPVVFICSVATIKRCSTRFDCESHVFIHERGAPSIAYSQCMWMSSYCVTSLARCRRVAKYQCIEWRLATFTSSLHERVRFSGLL